MPAKHLAALALSVLALGVLALSGATAASAFAGEPLEDRPASTLAPVHVHVLARRAASHGPSVTAALQSLLHSAAIDEASYRKDYSAYVAAKSSLGKLSGTRREELGAVLANVQAMAAAGELIPSRLGALFLTLERNRQWWTTEPLLADDERVSFPGSEIVWEHYPGQGIEIQWLATFGEANGYYLSGDENANLRQLLGEVIPLATERAGGIAWEYMFHFDGGTPPWTSGLSQGTALQVLARAWSRLKEPAYLSAAQQALGIFQTPPPQGVRVSTPAGALYAEYTYAPSDRILNGFIQSLVGLYDYTEITKDPLGLTLFEAGDAEARTLVPHYDTGAWSMYDQFGESDLNYHELLTEFLQHLCERTRKGPPLTPPGTQASGPASVQIPGDQIYCTTAQHFKADLRTPPVISLLSKTLPAGARAGVQFSLSKISTVSLTVRRGSKVVWTNSATVERGKPRLLWITPTKAGTFTIELTATDLAGNFSTTSGTVAVTDH
jgi:D-glucuronyl C5-epimerase C-terminus